MAKTIIIDTEVKGVDKALDDIDKIDSAVEGVSSKKISVGFDTANTEKQLDNLQKTGEKIEKVGQGIAGGFALATGVVGAFGSELGFSSEEIENAQQKASSFIGILVSIKPVVEGVGAGFKLLGAILKTNPIILLATIIGGIIVSFMDLGTIIDGVKKGFKAVGDAVSQAFDFIVEGIKYAIDLYTQYLDILTFGLFDINDAYKGYIKSIDDANKAEQERLKALEKEKEAIRKTISELQAKAKLLDAEIKLIEQQKKVVERRYDDEIAFARASGKETYAIEQQKLTDLIEFTKKEIALKLERYEIEKKLQGEILKLQEKSYGSFITNFQKNNSETIKAQRKANEDRKNDVAKLNEDLLNFERDLKVSRLAEQKDYTDKSKALEKERVDFIKGLSKDAREDSIKASQDITANDKLLSDKLQADRLKQIEEGKKQRQKDLEDQKKYREEQDKIDEESAEKDKKATEELNSYRIQSLSDSLSTLSNLQQLFDKKAEGQSEADKKKIFERQKKINIANALIDTYKGANVALASSPPPFNFISAGAVVTAGLLNVKKISETEFKSDSAGASASSSVGTGASLPQVDTSSTPFQFPSVGGNGQGGMNQNITAMVSVTEINTVQNRVEVAEANATFG